MQENELQAHGTSGCNFNYLIIGRALCASPPVLSYLAFNWSSKVFGTPTIQTVTWSKPSGPTPRTLLTSESSAPLPQGDEVRGPKGGP